MERESWLHALTRLAIGWVVVPVVACTVGYWLTRWILVWRGTPEPTASGWAWIVVAVLAFCLLGTGGGSAFVRKGEWEQRMATGRTWGDHEGHD